MFSYVFGRNEVFIAVGDLDIIAENFIIFNFKVFNSGAFSFLRLNSGNKSVAVILVDTQGVNLGVVAAADYVTVL